MWDQRNEIGEEEVRGWAEGRALPVTPALGPVLLPLMLTRSVSVCVTGDGRCAPQCPAQQTLADTGGMRE